MGQHKMTDNELKSVLCVKEDVKITALAPICITTPTSNFIHLHVCWPRDCVIGENTSVNPLTNLHTCSKLVCRLHHRLIR